MLPKVLLACPISEKKSYCLDAWLKLIRNLSYPEYNIFLVDNSQDQEFHKTITDKGFMCEYTDPKDDPAPIFITRSQNVLRDVFIEGGYDYFFSLECDVFPPKWIIEYMLHYRKDLLAIPYFLYTGEKTALSLQTIDMNYTNKRMRKMTGEETFYAFNGTLEDKYIPALGCTLMSNMVLKKIKFRVDLKKNKAAFSDSFFMIDCKREGISTYTDLSMIVEHQREGWEGSFDLWKN